MWRPGWVTRIDHLEHRIGGIRPAPAQLGEDEFEVLRRPGVVAVEICEKLALRLGQAGVASITHPLPRAAQELDPRVGKFLAHDLDRPVHAAIVDDE